MFDTHFGDKTPATRGRVYRILDSVLRGLLPTIGKELGGLIDVERTRITALEARIAKLEAKGSG